MPKLVCPLHCTISSQSTSSQKAGKIQSILSQQSPMQVTFNEVLPVLCTELPNFIRRYWDKFQPGGEGRGFRSRVPFIGLENIDFEDYLH